MCTCSRVTVVAIAAFGCRVDKREQDKAEQERQIEALTNEAVNGKHTRRDVIKKGIALGLTVPAIQSVLASGAFAQDAPTSPAAAGPVNVPIVVALRDLPTMYEEAAKTLGANRMQSLFRVELPLLGPGISAGILLTFVIVFNEFLVTLFIAGPHTMTAALTVYNLTRTGFLPSTAALAALMQFISFAVVLIFFKTFGSRYLKGTFLI